ncbi:MAG: NAD(P)H-hydrate epimerase, partial [Desulfococcus multivorans]|nr:NAD(P)H-hydrate epimerase [Desulfococcus multivorans]
MKISNVNEMRRMDQKAVQHYGIVEEMLMENAGLAAYRVLSASMNMAGKRILVVCGIGNNGGDGLVVARKIHSGGGDPRVIILSDPAGYKGAAGTNFSIISRLGLNVRVIDDAGSLHDDLCCCDAVVDAIFGTGLTRPVEGHYREVIQRINRSGKPVLSLDIPSGVAGDTGRIMGEAVRAGDTVTFGLPKVGNLLYPGYDQGGRLHVSHISFPPALYQSEALTIALNDMPNLPSRDPVAHKGSFGNALFIAGAAAYFGAPYFSASAFLKAGGGYARLAAPRSIIPVVAQKASEIVFHPQVETASGSIASTDVTALREL